MTVTDDDPSALRTMRAELKRVLANAETDYSSLQARTQRLGDGVRAVTQALEAKQRELDAKR